MIITEEVIMKWNASNRQWYKNKGYTFTKIGDKFKVKVKDLSKTSIAKIEIKCEYCNKSFFTSYYLYGKRQDNNILGKDYCADCKKDYNKERRNILQENNNLKKGDIGYWKIKENRLKELDVLIKNNNYNLTNIFRNKKWKQIKQHYSLNNDDIYKDIESLNYNIDELFKSKKPNGYYNSFERIEKSIRYFINNYNRFPLRHEILKRIGINSKIINFYGGVNSIKQLMNYNNKNDLIDDSGFTNMSYYEYYVAQFLISNNIHYSREKHPFPVEESLYRSDFTFYLENNEVIHCEVWGYPKNSTSKWARDYNKKRKLKETLYKNNNITLISIDCEIFKHGTYKDLNNYFKKKFNILNKYKLKEISYTKYIPNSSYSDEELLEKIMQYSPNKVDLPTAFRTNKSDGWYPLYEEVIKRFETYHNFAKSFGMEIITVNRDIRKKYRNMTIDELLKKLKDKKIIINNVIICQSKFKEKSTMLYEEIMFRYNNDYNKFVTENKLYLAISNINKKEDVFGKMEYMIKKYNKFLSQDEYKKYKDDIGLVGIKNAARKLKTTMTDLRLDLYNEYYNGTIPDCEIIWLKNVINNKSGNHIKYTLEEQNIAKNILAKQQLNIEGTIVNQDSEEVS